MRKSKWVLVLASILLILPLALACTQQSPAPAPPTSAAKPTTAAPAPAAQEIRWVWAGVGTAGEHGMYEIWSKAMVDMISKATNGRVKIEMTMGMLEMKDILQGVADGRVQGGNAYILYLSEWPQGDLGEYPFLFRDETEFFAAVDGVLFDNYQKTLADRYKVKTVAITGWAGQHIYSKKAVNKAEDFKGLKMRAPGYLLLAALKALGAVPVSVAGAEEYSATERGIIDGGIHAIGKTTGQGFVAISPYQIFSALTGGPAPAAQVINPAAWNALPADVQAQLTEGFKQVDKEYRSRELETKAKAIALAAQQGGKIINIPPEESDKWNAIVKDVVQAEYAKTSEKSVAPGGLDLLKAVQDFLVKYRASAK